MIFGIPDATLAAIVTLISGAFAWIIKEWRDTVEIRNRSGVLEHVRASDEYDFAGRLRDEIIRLQSLVKNAYEDSDKLGIQIDALREENLGLSRSVYDSKRENLKLKNEIAELSNEIDRLNNL